MTALYHPLEPPDSLSGSSRRRARKRGSGESGGGRKSPDIATGEPPPDDAGVQVTTPEDPAYWDILHWQPDDYDLYGPDPTGSDDDTTTSSGGTGTGTVGGGSTGGSSLSGGGSDDGTTTTWSQEGVGETDGDYQDEMHQAGESSPYTYGEYDFGDPPLGDDDDDDIYQASDDEVTGSDDREQDTSSNDDTALPDVDLGDLGGGDVVDPRLGLVLSYTFSNIPDPTNAEPFIDTAPELTPEVVELVGPDSEILLAPTVDVGGDVVLAGPATLFLAAEGANIWAIVELQKYIHSIIDPLVTTAGNEDEPLCTWSDKAWEGCWKDPKTKKDPGVRKLNNQPAPCKPNYTPCY
jgi:hypothetical protein